MRLRPLAKVLVANRGEIARRVLRAVRSEGLRCVAVYSDADRDALHVREADEAVRIGPAAAAESYLHIDRLMDAARVSGADAVHPGYGFLSENPAFARACEAEGIVFVGPGPETIALMANKPLAKQAVRQAGVPCIPGYAGPDQSVDRLAAEARALGFPLVIKAAAGGGGRGIRLVRSPEALTTELTIARAEARAAFGDEELMLERAMLGARHVEVQVLADAHGAVLHLGERDCSVQRRHQKIIEESPSPAVDGALRARLGEAAVSVARACAYTSAGTVEFLVDSGGRAFFLEMNTRIQVEHPVTEEVTGIDLVAWQLRIAAGARLRIRQEQVNLAGHAMEARLCAEDPAAAFLPQSGHIRRWQPPAGVRVEHALREGAEVGIHYDSLLAKVIAKGATREEARQRLCRALADTVLLGVPTNKTFLLRALEHEVFVQGRAATDFLDEWREPAVGASPEALAVAAVLLMAIGCETAAYDRNLMNWSNSAGDRRSVWRLSDGTRVASVVLHARGASPRLHRATVDGRTFEIELDELGETVGCTLDGMRRQAAWVLEGDTLLLDLGREVARIEDLTFAPASAAEGAGDGRLDAPLSGVVQTILVARGDVVERGQAVIVVESMKMLHTIASGIAGTVSEILVATGDAVRARQPLAVVVAKEEQGARDA